MTTEAENRASKGITLYFSRSNRAFAPPWLLKELGVLSRETRELA